MEGSREAGGIPLVFLLKSSIPLFAVLLLLQGLAQAVRAALTLMSDDSKPRDVMTGAELLAILLVVLVCGALMAGYPAALTLGGVSLAVALVADAFGLFPLPLLNALPSRIYGVIANETLMAIPLFIFMGVTLERSRVAEDLLESLARLLGNLRGGLGIAVLFVGLLLAAAKGVVGATTVTMGLIVLPAMLRHGYDPRLAAGTVAATSTLAQVFPPATVLVLLGDQIANAWQSAQLAKGVFAPQPVTVTDLFAGAIVPGFLLVALYLAYLLLVAWLKPKWSPAIPPNTSARKDARCALAAAGADRAAGADLHRARLDPRRVRDADRSRVRRRHGIAGARRLAQRAFAPSCSHRSSAAPRRCRA